MAKFNETGSLTEQQIQAVKIAVLEVLKEAGVVGPEFEKTLVDSTKVGVTEALLDTGMLDKQPKEQPDKGPSRSISFKDLPPEGKTQLAAQAGIQLSPEEIKEQEIREDIRETAKSAITNKQKQQGGKNASN
jgi:hypothetical protein